MRNPTRSLTTFALCLALAGASCGGDDSGSGSGTALSNEEFCAKVEALDGMDPSADDMAAVVATVEELADAAPSDELRDAMLALVPVMTALENLDENDPDAMSKIMEIMMDPEVIAAGELIEKFSSETCGIAPEDEGSTISTDTIAEPGSNGAYIFDDMETGDISDYVEANGSDLFPGGYVSSTSLTGASGYTDVVLDFAGAESFDGVGLCELILESINAGTADTAVRIVVQLDTVDIAVREVDGECAAV